MASPTRSRRVNARGAGTRQRLLTACLDVFDERGYFDTRMEDIAAAAGTSRATVYQYFSDKESLARELLGTAGGPLLSTLTELEGLGPGHRGAMALHRWLCSVSAAYDRHGRVYSLWARLDGTENRLGRLGERYLRRFAARLADQLRAGGVEGLDLDATAVALMAMIERSQLYRVRQRVLLPREALDESLACVIHRMLYPQV
jgi:AcrR family transcriptional regulator